MRDDGATRLDPGEEPGQGVLQVGALVEGAHADDDGVEARELLRGQIGTGEAVDDAAHLLKALGHGIARARQVADREALVDDLEAGQPRAGRRLQELHRK